MMVIVEMMMNDDYTVIWMLSDSEDTVKNAKKEVKKNRIERIKREESRGKE